MIHAPSPYDDISGACSPQLHLAQQAVPGVEEGMLVNSHPACNMCMA